MLLPDGSQKDVSMPYGCGVGGSLNTTPRADNESYSAWQSSVSRNSVPPAPLATSSLSCEDVASSNIGGAGTGISTKPMSGCPAGPTTSQRKFHSSTETSERTSHPSVRV